MLKGMGYSRLGNGAVNCLYKLWGVLNDYCKVNSISQWKKIQITIMGFAHALGLCRPHNACPHLI